MASIEGVEGGGSKGETILTIEAVLTIETILTIEEEASLQVRLYSPQLAGEAIFTIACR
jgi:hypothetical protein